VKEDNKLKVIISTESNFKKQCVIKNTIEFTRYKLITSTIKKCKTKMV